LANLALFYGLILPFMPDFVLGLPAAGWTAGSLTAGGIRVLFGFVGVSLTLLALDYRAKT
jgi:hypothetical protein